MQVNYQSNPPLDDAKSLEKESALNVAVSQLASDFDNLIYVWSGSPVQGTHPSSPLVLLSLSLILLSALEAYQRVEWLKYSEKRHLGRQHLHFILSRKPKRMEATWIV